MKSMYVDEIYVYQQVKDKTQRVRGYSSNLHNMKLMFYYYKKYEMDTIESSPLLPSYIHVLS